MEPTVPMCGRYKSGGISAAEVPPEEREFQPHTKSSAKDSSAVKRSLHNYWRKQARMADEDIVTE